MSIKKIHQYCTLALLLYTGSIVYAQEAVPTPEEDTNAEIVPSESKNTEPLSEAIARLPVYNAGFKIEPHYYGLPLSINMGWFYRSEDVSIFPNAGFSFLLEDEPVINTSVGFALRNGTFFYNAYAVYDILPFTMHKKRDEQVVYGKTNIGFTLGNVRLSFPVQAGRQRKYEITEEKPDSIPVTQKQVVTSLASGIRFDFFLADFGFFKSTGAATVNYHWIPKDNFHYYTLSADIPASFHLYYVDIACMYSFFHTGTVQYGKTAPLRRYEIEKPQHFITGRNPFKTVPKYRDLHIFSSEFRWYLTRLTSQTNGFFISLFADAGLGITKW
ncbi:MAG: hypothetical protein ACTTI3_04615 [Treponema sp.]